MRGLDVARRRGIVFECFAKLPDTVFQNGVGDERRRPHGVEKLLLGDELTAVFDEVLQHRERLRPQGDGLFAPPQPLIRRIEPKAAERHLLARLHYRNMTAT